MYGITWPGYRQLRCSRHPQGGRPVPAAQRRRNSHGGFHAHARLVTLLLAQSSGQGRPVGDKGRWAVYTAIAAYSGARGVQGARGGAAMNDRTIAALYVEENGCYYGLDGVDPWGVTRDARKYDGPFPVVAHPPCARWSALWFGSFSLPKKTEEVRR